MMFKDNRQKFLTLGLFTVYAFLLVWLILFKFQTNISDLNHIRNINLIPFAASMVVNGKIELREIIYNVLVFVPMGIYISIFKSKWSFLQKILPCLGVSVLFEVLQYIFAIGATDITDIIGNTLGGIIGIAMYGLIKRLFKDRAITVVNVMALISSVLVMVIMILVLSANTNNDTQTNSSGQKSVGDIYLYGEAHGVESILDQEFELWNEYYQNQGMRHLFIEFPYYTAEFLNLWMQSNSNDILDEIFNDLKGTAADTTANKEFYEKIKNQCPETIFHGTDVGHQYDTTGRRFLKYMQSNNLVDSEQYVLTQEAIDQGRYYYERSDDVYRENKMVQNFIREFDKLSNESIMGIYGSAHTGLESMNYTNDIPCMANQLKKYYGDAISSENLDIILEDIEPSRVDTIEVNGKEYEASYFGKQNLKGIFEGYSYREYWRLENAYEDFKDRPLTQDELPYNNYPMKIETGQIFMIDYTMTDGSVIRKYYRSDGHEWNGTLSTQEFTVD